VFNLLLHGLPVGLAKTIKRNLLQGLPINGVEDYQTNT